MIQIVSSCRTPSMQEQRKRPHGNIWGHLIGDLALQEGDTVDGVIYTLSCLCANSLRRDTEIADKYIGTAMDWVNSFWNQKQNDNTLLLDWGPIDKSDNKGGGKGGVKTKEKFEV